MTVKIEDRETEVVRHALENYLSNLRSEIVRTDNRALKNSLHTEEDILKDVISRMN